ncbi:MAG: hypothetical protein ACXWRE_12815 [Pseudobdellovibrionaceae bacterium]
MYRNIFLLILTILLSLAASPELDQLAAESQKLSQQKNRLEELKQSRQRALGMTSYTSQINDRDLEIQNLKESLGSYRQAEEDLNQSARRILDYQDNEARYARDQIDKNIQDLEQQIRDTQNELNFWQNYPAGLDFTNQKSEIERLQNQLAQQNNDLNALKVQRVDISAQVLNNSQVVMNQAERAKVELRASAMDIQEQIFSLRGEIESLQRIQNQSQNQVRALDAQLMSAEKEYEEQSRRVHSLEEALQTKKAEKEVERSRSK